MCSIFLSNQVERFNQMIDINQSRGKFSYSYSGFKNNQFAIIKKDFGLFDKNILQDLDIHIGHCQAPTGGLIQDINRVHPAECNREYLFHNGIIKPKFLIDENFTGWDTLYLLQNISKLDNIEGSFACVYIAKNKLYFFRNSLCPLFIIYNQNEISLSSIKVNNDFSLIPSGKIFQIVDGNLSVEKEFQDINKVYNI